MSAGPYWISLSSYLIAASSRATWQFVKNCIKLLLGRKPQFNERALFLRQFILHLTGLRRIRAITCVRYSGREGAGSQAHMVMNAISFARLCGLTYVHTPLRTVHHAEGPDDDWAARWESLFNLGAGEVPCSCLKHQVVNYCYAWPEIELCFGQRGRRRQQIEEFRAMIPELRRKYYLNRPRRTTREVSVGVHIRRGDISAGNRQRYISNESVRQTLNLVMAHLDARGTAYRIRIYSQGCLADFTDLVPLGAEFLLDADALRTMQELIEADILLMDMGFFSFYAGVISDGLRLFHPREFSRSGEVFLPTWEWMRQPMEEDWILCAPDGTIDIALFERRLTVLMESKEQASHIT